jgi:hypothetical protein
VHVKRNAVQEVAGEVVEFGSRKKAPEYSSDYKQFWYQSLVGHLESTGKNVNRGYHLYREKFGVSPPWKKVSGGHGTQAAMDSLNFLRHANIAYAKRRNAA